MPSMFLRQTSPCESHASEASFKEVRQDMLGVLETWLEQEVSQRLQSIDHKLDLLLSTPRRAPRHKSNFLAPAGKRSSSLGAKPRTSALRSSTQSLASANPDFDGETAVSAVRRFDDTPLRGSTDATTPHSAKSFGNGTSSIDTSQFRLAAPKSKFGNLVSRLSATAGVFQSPPRRNLQSDSFVQQVHETIAKHHGRGPRAVAVWRFLEHPYSSVLAWLYSVFIPVFVVFSVVISFVQTMENSPFKGGVGIWLQAGFESVYVTELITRFFVCPDRCAFFFNWFNWIDAVSAVPLVLRIFADKDQLENDSHASNNLAKAVVVTVPLFRLLKIIRRFEKFQLLHIAFSMAFEALPVLLYTLMLIALFFSVVLYFLEPVDNIGDLPTALWFIVVTMTTVGYGDKTPVSVEGHVVAVMLMIISSLYMAIPIGIVGHAFSQAWADRDRLLLMHRLRDSFTQEGFTAESVKRVFALFDDNHDGELDLHEFSTLLGTMNISLSEERIIELHESIDLDGGGTVNVNEIFNRLFPKGYFENWRANNSNTPIGRMLSGGSQSAGSKIAISPEPPMVTFEGLQATDEIDDDPTETHLTPPSVTVTCVR